MKLNNSVSHFGFFPFAVLVYFWVTIYLVSTVCVLPSTGANSTMVLLNLISHNTLIYELKNVDKSFESFASITLQFTMYSCYKGKLSFLVIFFLTNNPMF